MIMSLAQIILSAFRRDLINRKKYPREKKYRPTIESGYIKVKYTVFKLVKHSWGSISYTHVSPFAKTY